MQELDLLERERSTWEQQHQAATKTLKVLESAQLFINTVAQLVQQKLHTQIADVVTRCLQTVFDDPYTFKINFEEKRGKTEAVLLFERDGLEVDPLTSAGGGVIDVACFGLRVAVLLADHRAPRRLIVLDEPFKFVSLEYRSGVGRLLEELATELNVQFIIVTHVREFELGKVYEV